jgi:hypothetical protein
VRAGGSERTRASSVPTCLVTVGRLSGPVKLNEIARFENLGNRQGRESACVNVSRGQSIAARAARSSRARRRHPARRIPRGSSIANPRAREVDTPSRRPSGVSGVERGTRPGLSPHLRLFV